MTARSNSPGPTARTASSGMPPSSAPTNWTNWSNARSLKTASLARTSTLLPRCASRASAPFGRCTDADFFALTAYYVDIDDDVVGAARERYRAAACPPTAAVVTGRQPHTRAQLLWRMETPERDAEFCRAQNLALAAGARRRPSGGQPRAGTAARRLHRLADQAGPGSRTDRIPATRRRPGESLLRRPAGQGVPDQAGEGTTDRAAAAATSDLNIGGAAYDGVSVDACLEAARAGDHWHDNLVRLTAHWIARGWSDTEILAAAESLTLAGYTVEQTRRDVAGMIAGGRAKWNIPNPRHELDDDAPRAAVPLAPAFVNELNIAMLPRRRWVLGRSLIRGHLSVKVAPPGVGKSTLCLERAVAVVTGRNITGEPVHERTKVWLYNNEDDGDELKRRLAAVLQHWDIPLDDVRGRLAMNSGADRPLLTAKADRAGNVVRLPDVDGCIAHITAHGIGVFIVDPFVETHEVNENANDQIKVVAALFREIARRGNCAVMLVHHTAKPPQGTADGHAGNLNTARGASALAGVARVVQTLFAMSPRDAEQLDVKDQDRRLYVRLDDAKANLGLISGEASWFRRVSVTIANGDEVGVLVAEDLQPASDDADADDDLYRTIIACLLALVPEAEISLNAAARQLAWSADERFAKYRQTDSKGNRRASKNSPRRDPRRLRPQHLHRGREPLTRLHLQPTSPAPDATPVRATGERHRSRLPATGVRG